MKRSEINAIIEGAQAFFSEQGFHLPEWAFWNPEQWAAHKNECKEIFDCKLGWDITDFGSGRFETRGLTLFTLRNGLEGSYPKPYAEKIMVVGEEQETPFHFHWNKMEDIINRGGGKLAFELYMSDAQDGFSTQSVTVSVDGVKRTLKAGERLVLDSGSSLSLPQRLYHRFFAVKGYGKVMCGEVSMVNDDDSDNRFKEELGRFPAIDEDVPPTRLMVGDYRRFA
ncbi:D-lyxose/D-mannose family sugar isomerase [Sediminispirochaeta bajacaliforniensis]|uniref:D-lyxose/D-mannose family sugar isomerase n=1 Tax=Sediminispirochaeta bajacaliforniensis TaxID=148 RepID=UPI00037BD96B|nr:D-lyxose/D-mannose family sugar isomerase [Sediminispirochaeta bajacaliforniensis]